MRIPGKGVGSVPDFADPVPDFAELQLERVLRYMMEESLRTPSMASSHDGPLGRLTVGGASAVRSRTVSELLL